MDAKRPLRKLSDVALAQCHKGWERSQYSAFRAWVNHLLAQRRAVSPDPDAVPPDVQELELDLRSGVVLGHVLEAIKPGAWRALKLASPPHSPFVALENCTAIVRFVQERCTPLQGLISGRDIFEGNIKLILGLLWALIYSTRVRVLETLPHQGAPSPLELVLTILRDACDHYGVRAPANLTSDLADGTALACLLALHRADLLGDPHKRDPGLALLREVHALLEQLGCPALVEAEEVHAGAVDQRTMLLYLSFVLETLKKPAVEPDALDDAALADVASDNDDEVEPPAEVPFKAPGETAPRPRATDDVAAVEASAAATEESQELGRARELLGGVADMADGDIAAQFADPTIRTLMLAFASQLRAERRERESAAAAAAAADAMASPSYPQPEERLGRVGMMERALWAGRLSLAQRAACLEACQRLETGLAREADQPACNVCGEDWQTGSGVNCMCCGTLVCPLCLAGIKRVQGHALQVPVCTLCASSLGGVLESGFGWVPKEVSLYCRCSKEFSLTRWRHRCRSCGRVHCDDCSVRAVIPGYPTRERVCNLCLANDAKSSERLSVKLLL